MCFNRNSVPICRFNQVKTEHIPMKIYYLKNFVCTDLSDEQSAFDGLQKIVSCLLISFFSLQLNEFLQSEIQQTLTSIQKVTCITGIADKKIIIWGIISLSGVLCSPLQFAVQIKQFLQFCLYFLLESSTEEGNKANQELHVN